MIYCRLARAEESSGDTSELAGQGQPIYFTAATAGVKSDGYDLGRLPWDFSRARAGDNGPRFPFLFVHDMTKPSIGVVEVLTAPDVQPTRIAAYFDPDDPDAVALERKYRSKLGGMDAVSVQWMTVDKAGNMVRNEREAAANQLMEISACAVGLDGDALQDGARGLFLQRQAVALRSLARELDAVMSSADIDDAPADGGDVADDAATPAVEADSSAVGGEADAEADGAQDAPVATLDDNAFPETPERAWAAMVRAFDRQDGASDDVRRKRYNRAEAAYRKLGMVAPEWLGGDELRALDDAAWRGLWLEGEIVAARAGAVLSRRNLARLDAAIDALMEIRREASGEDGEDVKPKPGDDTRAAIGEAIDGLTVDDLQRLAAALFGGK